MEQTITSALFLTLYTLAIIELRMRIAKWIKKYLKSKRKAAKRGY